MDRPQSRRTPSDLLAKLEKDLLDPRLLLTDVLRTCQMLAYRTRAEQLRKWTNAELDGYPSYAVPDYRRLTVQVMQEIRRDNGYEARPFDTDKMPDIDGIHLVANQLDFNVGVGAIETAIAQSESGGWPYLKVSNKNMITYVTSWNSNIKRPYELASIYYNVPLPMAYDMLSKIRTVLVEFAANLGSTIHIDGPPPSADQADHALLTVVGSATISNLNVYSTNVSSRTENSMTDKSRIEYNFGDVKGNLAAGSSNVSQVYNDGLDIDKARKFANFITEISGLLELEPDQREELEAGTAELHAAIDDSGPDRTRIRRAVDAVMKPLKLAGSTAAKQVAIEMGNQVGSELEAIIHHLPHP